MYQLMYSAQTKDIHDVDLAIEIYKDTTEEITAKELTLGGDEPIIIEYDAGDDIFKTLIQSSCTIKVVTDEPLLSLYTGKLNEICVQVYRDNKLFWYGFLTPNVYSQDYEAGPNEFELEFIDLIAQLDNIDFKKVGSFKSFYQYINNAVEIIDTLGVITGYVNQEDLSINLKTMGVLERNFIDETADEEDGAMTYKEMFESIVAWMSKSMIQWGDKLFLVDLSKLKNGVFGLYDRSTAEKSYYELDTATKNLKYLNGRGNLIGDIGVNDASCSISLDNVYNKVTVIANTNEIDNVIPDIFDEDKKVSAMQTGLDYTTTTYVSKRDLQDNQTDENRTYVMLNAFFVNKEWGLPYGISSVDPSIYYSGFDVVEYNEDGTIKTLRYKNGTKTNVLNDNVNTPELNLTTFTWCIGNVDTGIVWEFYNLTCTVTAKTDSDGYWIVNVPVSYDGNDLSGTEIDASTIINLNSYGDPTISYQLLSNHSEHYVSQDNVSSIQAMSCIQKYFDYCVADGVPSEIKWNTVLTLGRTSSSIDWDFDLDGGTKIKYRGNNDPDTYVTLLSKPTFVGKGGYFILSMSYIFSNNYLFANTTPYNFTPETYGTCLSYASIDTDCSFREDKFKVILKIGDYSYNGSEWVQGDAYFYITHKNNTGDKIFGVTKSIDNTVSYSWNLASSQDGYAIKLPDDKLLNGELTFTLYADSRLGGPAQYSNHGWVIQHWGDADTKFGWGTYDGYLQNVSPIWAIHIDKLELIYTTKDTVSDVYNLEEYDPDIKYTNVVDESYVKQLDDIELTTNTYTPHAVSYSYVLKKVSDTSYEYVEEIDGLKQEERILQKYVYHYKDPKLKYENNLDADLVTPFSPIYIKSLDKEMIPIGLEYDLASDRVTTQLTEF